MARTAAETLDLLQAIIMMAHHDQLFHEGTLAVDVDNIIAELAVGGEEVPENSAIESALRTWMSLREGSRSQFVNVMNAMLPALGRLAGAPSLSNASMQLDYMQKYLIDNSKQIKLRGFTKDTSSTVSGNGDGKIAIRSTDINSDVIDVGHAGSLTFTCDRDSTQGATQGGERFLVGGTPAGKVKPWDEGGPYAGNSYDYAYGSSGIAEDIGPGQRRARSGGRVTAWSATRQRGNLVQNGDFELAIEGTGSTKLPGWTINSGDSTLTQVSSDPINGLLAIEATANFEMDSNLTPANVRTNRFYGVGLKLKTENGGSGTVTGTLTVKIMDRDEGATHHTLTVDLSTLTPQTKTIIDPEIFFVPKAAEDLKVQVELASLGGTASTPTVELDDIVVGEATLVDGYMVFIMDGTTVDSNNRATGMFKFGDSFTLDTTLALEEGLIQKYINRFYQRYFAAGSSASTDFEDPTDAAAVVVRYNGSTVSDTGTVALGTVGTGAHTVDLQFTNTGNRPLGVAVPTADNATNATFTGTSDLTAIWPGETVTLSIEVTDGGAGAFSIDVHFVTTDPTIGTFDVTVSGTAT